MMIRSTAGKLTAAGFAAALLLAVATPTTSEARDGRAVGAAVGGFAAGALVGAAAANAAGYHHPGYAYGPGYVHAPGYAYAPGYAHAMPGYSAYAAVPGYAEPGVSGYAYAPFQGREISRDMAGQPIYAYQLSPWCTYGDKLAERC